MFGRNKHKDIPLGQQSEKPRQTSSEHLSVMPELFYGGADPDIYQESENKNSSVLVSPHLVSAKTTEGIKKKQSNSAPPQSTAGVNFPEEIVRSKKWLFILGGVVFLLIIVFISWYYISTGLRSDRVVLEDRVETNQEDLGNNVEPEPVPVKDDFVDNNENEIEEDIEEPISLQEEQPLILPRIIAAEDNDLDGDDLGDSDEEIFGTDSGIVDTDGDGYGDSLEVRNLYSPINIAPTKLVDSGRVREYVNPRRQYRLYYPSVWEVAVVDNTGDHILISSPTGDFIEVRAFDKREQERFQDWFARIVPNEQFSSVKEEENRFDISVRVRNDRLVGYIEQDDTVYMLVYYPGEVNILYYRFVMEMMIQSFRPTRAQIDLPDQQIIPREGGVEDSEVVEDSEIVGAP